MRKPFKVGTYCEFIYSDFIEEGSFKTLKKANKYIKKRLKPFKDKCFKPKLVVKETKCKD